MDQEFFKIVIATSVANFLAIWFLYSLYGITKRDERNEESKVSAYGGVVVPLLFILAGMYYISG